LLTVSTNWGRPHTVPESIQKALRVRRRKEASSAAFTPAVHGWVADRDWDTGDAFYVHSGTGERVYPDGGADAILEEFDSSTVDRADGVPDEWRGLCGGRVSVETGYKVVSDDDQAFLDVWGTTWTEASTGGAAGGRNDRSRRGEAPPRSRSSGGGESGDVNSFRAQLERLWRCSPGACLLLCAAAACFFGGHRPLLCSSRSSRAAPQQSCSMRRGGTVAGRLWTR